jgi:hypothetical protein
MGALQEITDALISTLTPVPQIGPGVCDICHGGPNGDFARCYSCDETVGQVSRPVRRVVPISMYEPEKGLHHLLRSYKSNRPPPQANVRVAALIGRFVLAHGGCLVGDGEPFTLVTTVPSTRDRVGEHPLVTAIRRVSVLRDAYSPLLTRGSAAIGHNNADDDGYQVTAPVRGHRVLLIDDTFTSGARVQSAASALRNAGAAVPAALVVGRIINPDWNEACRAIWDRVGKQQFDFATCCVHRPGHQTFIATR